MSDFHLGILYSFRRCPYAMRARLACALFLPPQSLELREVVLKNKPKELLAISPKATVPVLQLADGTVIDESRDIMLWALDHYKYSDRYKESKEHYRELGEVFLTNTKKPKLIS